MTFAGVNYLAVFAAAATSFILGWIWYGVLFKNQWMAALGKTPEECKDQGSPVAPMIITLIAQLVMAMMLAGIIGHLGPSGFTLKNGIITGALIWLGFVLTTMAVNHQFQGVKRALTLIDAGHWLAVLSVQGAILGFMGI